MLRCHRLPYEPYLSDKDELGLSDRNALAYLLGVSAMKIKFYNIGCIVNTEEESSLRDYVVTWIFVTYSFSE